MTLSELAQHLQAELRGAPGQPDPAGVPVRGIAGIEEAGPDQVTFIANKKYVPLARSTRAAAILVEPGFPDVPVPTLRLENPYLAYARTIELFYAPPALPSGIHPTAVVAATASLGARASIGPYAVIGEQVRIGDDAAVHAHVTIYDGVTIGSAFTAHSHAVVREHCHLGDRVTLQNGCIIGADGFGFARTSSGWHKIVQSGPVFLEDDVEVQANACVDRASIGETRIRRGAKIDNLVQVGHGSRVGEHTLLCAQVGLAGSTTVGDRVILAGQVGVAGHCTVGDGVIATAQSGIPGDVEPGKMVSGYPAVDNRQWLRSVALFNRLPELFRNMRKR